MSQSDSDENMHAQEPADSTPSEGIDRRTVLKTGAVLGAAAVLTSKQSLAQSSPQPPAPPVLCGVTPPASPATTPFKDELAIPPPAVPVILNPLPTQAANTA